MLKHLCLLLLMNVSLVKILQIKYTLNCEASVTCFVQNFLLKSVAKSFAGFAPYLLV